MAEMKLTRRQELALRFLAACPWTEQLWWSVSAALEMYGEKSVNGRVTCDSLVRAGLATLVATCPSEYQITQPGRELASTLPKLEVR